VNVITQTELRKEQIPSNLRPKLIPVAQRIFWWGQAEEWLEDSIRFVAQLMTYGDLDDVRLTLKLLGDRAFLDTLRNPPAGVFDPKSWTFWHTHYHMPVPPLPTRRL
jgi:hypothetical protein